QGVTTQVPGHADAVKLLERMQSVASDPALLATLRAMLVAGYTATSRFKEAVALLLLQVEATSEVGQRVALLRQAAKLKADRLADPKSGYADLERAFREAPLDADLRADLERLAEGANAWQSLAGAYKSALQVVQDG